MSVIEKMSIMGIRSFGPEDHNKQVIEFFKPLTLILGPNGSGKTTIIECLKYMSTGDPPPNSDRGGSFVHDPKEAGEPEVKGQVKLQFKDIIGKTIIATRSLMAIQKLKKVQMKTLEGTITRYGANNTKTSLSSKCAEIDSEMITALGVSKAILNSVIFCHQEDSNWPLSEGKALKQRFDEIFAATRYIKALEEIRKIRLKKMQDIKLFKSEVISLKNNRRKAQEFSVELEKTKARLSSCKDTVLSVESKLKPISAQLKEISVKENEIGSLQSSLVSNEDIVEKYEKDVEDLRISIKVIFNGSKEELCGEMKDFNAMVSERRKKLEKIKNRVSELESKKQLDLKVKSKLLEELGKLKSDHQRHEDRIAARDLKLRDLRSTLGLGELGFDEDEPLIESQVENVIRNLKQRNAATQNEFTSCKGKHEAVEKQIQSSIDKIRVEKAQKQQRLSSSNEQIAKNKAATRNINSELTFVDTLASRQDDLEEDLKETEADLKILEMGINIDDLKEKVTKNQRKKKEIDAKVTALNQEMGQLQKESKTRTEIDLVNKDITMKQEAVDKVIQRHKDTVLHLLGEVPSQSINDKINKLIVTLMKKIESVNKNIEKERKQLTCLETSKKMHNEQMEEKKKTLSDHQSKVFDVCGSQDFDAGLEQLQNTIKELQDEKGALTGSLYLYNRYIESISSPRPCCPLCTRSFPTNDEAQALIRKLQGKLQTVPSSLDKKTKLISDKQKILNNMLELRPLKDVIVSLSEKEIPNLKSMVDKEAADALKISSQISDLEESLDSLNSDMKIASAIVPDLIALEQNLREVDRLKRRLSSLASQLGGKDISRTIQQVNDEQKNAHEELKSLSNEIDEAQQRINDHGERLQQLRSRINDLKAEKVQIASGMQKKISLLEQLGNLAEENKRLAEVVKDVKADIQTLEVTMNELVTKKEAASKEKESALEKMRAKIKSEEKEMESIDLLTKDISRYIKEERESKLINHEEKLKAVGSEIDIKLKEINKLSSEEKELNKDIASQEVKYRDLEDNLKLKETLGKISHLQSKCDALKSKIGNYDFRSLLNEKERLKEQERRCTKERDESEGRQKTLQEQILGLKRQLEDDMFKDADRKHREMSIELRTTELACEDLSKYYTALNRAVMNYHQMKMTEINKIVKDLWSQTYSGNDIDAIEIQSNEDDSDTGLEKAKRQYNYKVVSVKGDTTREMRGKCSAGQKVLASLIIRLALAETFCLNCGILALDEPTTNLDRDNISNLAHALVQLVNSRSEQRNFQLVIITHDEDFIELLGRSETVEYFYKISKDSNNFSKVNKCFISEMN